MMILQILQLYEVIGCVYLYESWIGVIMIHVDSGTDF